MMRLGAQAVFVGSGSSSPKDPSVRARAIVQAITDPYKDPDVLAKVSADLGDAMPGIETSKLKESDLLPDPRLVGADGPDVRSRPARRPPRAGRRQGGGSPARNRSARRRAPVDGGWHRAADRATAGRAVLFFYPRTGEAGKAAGPEWDAIAGARGCTPQSCGFRDLHREFESRGVRVLGVSTQTTEYQRVAVERLHLPFEILSDAELALTRALRLPTFEYPVPSGGGTR